MNNADRILGASSLEDLVAVLRAGAAEGAEPDESDLSLLDHNLQCASVLRRQRPGDLQLQVAGLVHDIGHTLAPDKVAIHAQVAAEYIEELLGPRVAALVRLHIEAKRYLVSTEPSYRRTLSADSIRTLVLQGEVMSPDEVKAFASGHYSSDAVALRRADEAAKIAGLAVDSLDSWLPELEEVAGHVSGSK